LSKALQPRPGGGRSSGQAVNGPGKALPGARLRHELLGRGIGRARRPSPVEKYAEFILDFWPTRCRAANFHVTQKLADDVAFAARVAFSAGGERFEDGRLARRLPRHGRGDGLLHVAGVES